MGTHALVCLCCDNLGFDRYFAMPFDSEEEAIQFAVDRLVEHKIISRDDEGKLLDESTELASNEHALEHYQNSYLTSSEYFHVVEIMQPPVKLFVPPGEDVKDPHESLNSDVTSSEARALHRVVRAMHDGNCPKCGHLGPSNTFNSTLGHVCPECSFFIRTEESEAALRTFQPFMALNAEIFEKWRATRNATEYRKTNAQPVVAEPFRYQSGFSVGDAVRLKFTPKKYNRDQGLLRGDLGCVVEPPNPESWPVDAVQISTAIGQGGVEAECLERC